MKIREYYVHNLFTSTFSTDTFNGLALCALQIGYEPNALDQAAQDQVQAPVTNYGASIATGAGEVMDRLLEMI